MGESFDHWVKDTMYVGCPLFLVLAHKLQNFTPNRVLALSLFGP